MATDGSTVFATGFFTSGFWAEGFWAEAESATGGLVLSRLLSERAVLDKQCVSARARRADEALGAE